MAAARAGDACKKNGARKKEILNSFFGFCTAKWKIKMNSQWAYQLNHM